MSEGGDTIKHGMSDMNMSPGKEGTVPGQDQRIEYLIRMF